MTPNQFVTDAIRTESKVDVIQANESFLNDLLDGITRLSAILDQVKKNAFYGKAFDEVKVSANLHAARMFIDRMNISIITSEVHPLNTKTDLAVNPRLFHAIVGIATESSELLEAMSLGSADFDRVNILEELGDINWYEAIGIDAVDAKFEEDVLDRVIAKLCQRYPNKFTSEAAINRDVVAERAVLERHVSAMNVIEIEVNGGTDNQ